MGNWEPLLTQSVEYERMSSWCNERMFSWSRLGECVKKVSPTFTFFVCRINSHPDIIGDS